MMSPRSSRFGRKVRGMTLLELTVVILVLLSLIGILFIGTQGWKRGSDRSLCIMNIRNVQGAVRSFANMNDYVSTENVTGLKGQIIGSGKFVEKAPACPASGVYSYGPTLGENIIPAVGDLYLQCSLATSDNHIPVDFADW